VPPTVGGVASSLGTPHRLCPRGGGHPLPLIGDPFLLRARVALVHPGVPQPRELLLDFLEHQRHWGAILDVGAVNLGSQHQYLGLDHQMPLAPAEFPAAIVASNAADARSLVGLAIDDAGAGLAVASDSYAEALPEGGMDALPGAIQSPEPEVVIDDLPGWELVGEQSPLAATADNAEHRVEDFAVHVCSGTPQGLERRQVRLDTGVLFLREIGGVS
jgi:hypothetical protein